MIRRVILASAALLATTGCPKEAGKRSICEPTQGRVTDIKDGDTIVIEAPDRPTPVQVRYLLVDTPERCDPSEGGSRCFAETAAQLNERLVLGREVELEYDAEDPGQCDDMFDRNLAYVFVGERMINRILVERGYGRVLVLGSEARSEPYTYESEFEALEEAAVAQKAGLWGICNPGPELWDCNP